MIDPHYFEDETDLDILTEAFKYAVQVGQTEPFKDLVDGQIYPSADVDLSVEENARSQ